MPRPKFNLKARENCISWAFGCWYTGDCGSRMRGKQIKLSGSGFEVTTTGTLLPKLSYGQVIPGPHKPPLLCMAPLLNVLSV